MENFLCQAPMFFFLFFFNPYIVIYNTNLSFPSNNNFCHVLYIYVYELQTNAWLFECNTVSSSSLSRGSSIAKIIGHNVKASNRFDPMVTMWVFEEMVDGRKLSEVINTEHENVKYLPGHKLPRNVVSTMACRGFQQQRYLKITQPIHRTGYAIHCKHGNVLWLYSTMVTHW